MKSPALTPGGDPPEDDRNDERKVRPSRIRPRRNPDGDDSPEPTEGLESVPCRESGSGLGRTEFVSAEPYRS